MVVQVHTVGRHPGRCRRLGAGLALGLGVLVFAHGCGGSGEERRQVAALTESCLINSDCRSPLVCAFKRCHDACETSRDCPDGQRCLASDRPFHVCQLPDETNCYYHSDCPIPLVCGADTKCRDQCSISRDCLEGQVCTQGTCADEAELENGKLPETAFEGEEVDGQPCVYTTDCSAPLVCRSGLCRPECQGDRDCQVGAVCRQGSCTLLVLEADAPDYCANRETDGDESDVDCGGSCLPCGPGAHCEGDDDCDSANCLDGVCQAPTCNDELRNGAELGEDCGGPTCDACPAPAECEASSDCDDDQVCKEGSCRASACGNGAVDAGETAADCGGPECAACDHGLRCVIDGDCVSLNCELGRCATPTCIDSVPNGGETGRDCGGPDCGLCADGVGCERGVDCASGVCSDGVCLAAECDDGVVNGDESDVDCGGGDCDSCPTASSCRFDGDCAAENCVGGSCGEAFTLSVEKTGAGQGSVRTSDNRLQCGSTCTTQYIDGSSVTLSAAPDSDSVFAGWAGDCSGNNSCVLVMDGDSRVSASFQPREPVVGWAVSLAPAAGNLAVRPSGLIVDTAGNSYLAGALTNGANFGAGTITPAGAADGYLVKYDASGQLDWALTIGSSGSETARGVALDASGDLFVTGYLYSGTSAYGGDTLACSSSSMGIAKFNDSGGYLGSNCVGSATYSGHYNSYVMTGNAVAVRSNGNAVFGGVFTGTRDFGGHSLSPSSGSYAWALVEVSGSDLSVQAAISLGGATDPYDELHMVGHPDDGTIVVAGSCGTFDLDASVPGARAVVGGAEACVVKLDDSLAPVWARTFGSSGQDAALSVTLAANDDVIVTGEFESSIGFGGSVPPAVAADGLDGFVVRLAAADGAPIWSRAFGGPGTDRVSGAAVDAATGNIAVIGDMSSGLDLGTGVLPHVGGQDAFFALLDGDGSTLDARAAGSDTDDPAGERASGIAKNPAGGFLLYGRTSSPGGTAFGLADASLDFAYLVSLE